MPGKAPLVEAFRALEASIDRFELNGSGRDSVLAKVFVLNNEIGRVLAAWPEGGPVLLALQKRVNTMTIAVKAGTTQEVMRALRSVRDVVESIPEEG